MPRSRLPGFGVAIALLGAAAGYLVAPVRAQPAPSTQGNRDVIYPGMMGPGMMGPGPGLPPGSSLSPASGTAVFQSQCSQCHTLAANAQSPGPTLNGLFGRKAGSVPRYPYSAAMRRSGITWATASLDQFIAAPQSVVPGTIMAYPGLPDPQARRAIEAYLQVATK